MLFREMGQCMGKIPPPKESAKMRTNGGHSDTSPTKNGHSQSPSKSKSYQNPASTKDVHIREARSGSQSTAGRCKA